MEKSEAVRNCPLKKASLQNFAKFIGTHKCWRLFFNKISFCRIWEFLTNNFLYDTSSWLLPKIFCWKIFLPNCLVIKKGSNYKIFKQITYMWLSFVLFWIKLWLIYSYLYLRGLLHLVKLAIANILHLLVELL